MMDRERDDWMHPNMAPAVFKDMKRPDEEFLIMRQRVIVCSWVGSGPPTEWAEWQSFDTREKRDAEFKRLRETTSWTLKKAHRLHGRHVDEDDLDDLRARLRVAEALAKVKKSRRQAGAAAGGEGRADG